jgi:hypothetical protein
MRSFGFAVALTTLIGCTYASADVFIQQIDPRVTPGGSIGGESPAYLQQLPLEARPVPPRPAPVQQRRAAAPAPVPAVESARPSWPDIGSGVQIAVSATAPDQQLPSVGSGVGRQ